MVIAEAVAIKTDSKIGITSENRKKQDEETNNSKAANVELAIDNNSFVSHELRAMMFGMTGNLQMISELHKAVKLIVSHMPNNASKIQLQRNLLAMESPIKSIESATHFGSAYTNGSLSIAKLKASELTITEFDPQSLIDKIVGINVSEAERNKIKINFKTLPERFSIRTDETRLYQVLNGLVVNAIKFVSEKALLEQGCIDITFNFSVKNESTILSFEVRDNGIGISKEGVDHLFQPFSQVKDQPSSKKYAGSGLGLYLSKIIVEQLGGSIACESKGNEGSTFKFTIKCNGTPKPLSCPSPVLFSQSAIAPAKSALAVLDKKTRFDVKHEKRILIVDDIKVNQKILATFLENAGFVCDIANSGEEVIKLIEAGEKYDLILMDKVMPGLDGMETTQRIRTRETLNAGKKPVPIIGVTATQPSPALLKEMQDCGMDYCVDKPTDSAKRKTLLTMIQIFTQMVTIVQSASEAQMKDNARKARKPYSATI